MGGAARAGARARAASICRLQPGVLGYRSLVHTLDQWVAVMHPKAVCQPPLKTKEEEEGLL